MGFILHDLGSDRDIQVNSWNWRPTIEIISEMNLIEEERLELIQYQLGTEITEDEAHEIGRRLQKEILPLMKSEERVTIDLQLTDEPDNGKVYQDEEWKKNYGATYKWLTEFAEFCLSSKGFSVY